MTDSKHERAPLGESLDMLGVKPLLPKVYEDLVQPSAQHLGRKLVVVARTVEIALAPLEGLVWGYDQVREWLIHRVTQKLTNSNQEEIQTPPPNIAGPAMLNLRFAVDIPQLREMYASLVASAMDKATASSAHPAFVHIIEQLSGDEARITTHLRGSDLTSSICHQVWREPKFGEFDTRDTPEDIFQQWDKICEKAGVENPENNIPYLDNLLRLRILEDSSRNISDLITEPGRHGLWDARNDESTERFIFVTEFGKQFIKTCVT